MKRKAQKKIFAKVLQNSPVVAGNTLHIKTAFVRNKKACVKCLRLFFFLFNYVQNVSFENAEASGTEFSRFCKHVTFFMAGNIMLNEC